MEQLTYTELYKIYIKIKAASTKPETIESKKYRDKVNKILSNEYNKVMMAKIVKHFGKVTPRL